MPPPPPNDAPKEVKEEFEAQVDVFSGSYDEYQPTGSRISVAERRTIVAVTTVATMIPLPGKSQRARTKR